MIESLAPKGLSNWLTISRMSIFHMSEIRDRESSTERLQGLTATVQGQRASRIRNQSTSDSNRSAFNYDPIIDHPKQRAVTVGAMGKTFKC